MNLFNDEKILVSFPKKSADSIKIAITFPNTYQIGMASLGYQMAWKILNESENVNAVRWFTDIKECAQKNIQFNPEYIGFSLSWELDFMNIFNFLKKENIPIHSSDRNDDDSIIFAGGLVPNANPEPFCKNFDFFLMGDLEVSGKKLTEALHRIKDLSRSEKLKELSLIEGIYVPSLSEFSKIKKPSTKGELSWSPIITPNSYWANTFIVEAVRSCPELCRFCLASYGSLPFRTQEINNSLIPIVDFGLKHVKSIGILGASVTQHPDFELLLEHLVQKKEAIPDLHVQIASVRADTITESLASKISKLGIKSVTMAIESGSERLREIINKKVSNETIFKSIKTLYDAEIKKVKLYGIVGLPNEEWKDLEDTIKLLKELKNENKYLNLTWGCSVFVPKAGTPFQYFGVDKEADKKLMFYKKELAKIGVGFKPESYKWALVQALISRGDRSINQILETAYEYGGSLGSFNKAMRSFNETSNKKTDYFIHENWDFNEVLPWNHIEGFLSKEVIDKHAMASE